VSSSIERWDVIVVGAGHNGLVCAAYLAGAGLSVCVLERRGVVGGAAVTEEFHPGFRNSTASYTVSLLQPKVIRDLRLAEHGLRIVERPVANYLPLPGGDGLCLGPDLSATLAAVQRRSRRDAGRLPAYLEMLDAAADLLRAWLLRSPPNAGGGLRDAASALRLATDLHRLPMSRARDLLDLLTRSAGEMLDHWFETDALKAAFGFDAVVGNYASPYEAGTAYVLLHHVMGEVNGRRGAWGHALGGMGAITQAMAAEARARGATIRTEHPVARILSRYGRVTGVALEDGRALGAACVVANVNPKRLYLDMVDPDALDAELLERMSRYRCGSGTFRMNLALSELPRFESDPEPGPHLSAGIIIAPSLDYMERAYFDARRDGWSREPVIEMLIPSTLDDSLAPRGAHVASLFCQHVSPRLPDGSRWAARRERVAGLMIDTVTRYAPNFRNSVLGYRALTPEDLEAELGLVDGDIFHGALVPGQLFSARPLLGLGDYRGALDGLYLCGSGAHPGGGVTGAPGHNAARAVLGDRRGLQKRRRTPSR
jgi:phytoene dehydrogenase-like protein